MASKVEALVRSFLKTDGDALCLVLGERMYLKRGASNSVVGREPLSQESFRAIADELAPGDLLESLVETSYKVPFRLDDQSETVQIDFSGTPDVPAMTIVRPRTSASASRASAPAAAAAPVAASIPRPAPAARPVSPPSARVSAGGSGRAIDRILTRMLECEASDVHLSSDNSPMFRIHGEMTV